MSLYTYKAMDAEGQITRGHLAAANVPDLERHLKHQGLDLIRAHPGAPYHYRLSRMPRRELIEFCFHLEQLVGAGVPIIDALSDLRDSAEHPVLRNVIAEIVSSIEAGTSFSQSLAQHPALFDSVFIGLVAAGEHAGRLPAVLRDLTEDLKWQDELAAQTKRLVLYPAFLGTLVCGVSIFLLVYLVPKMAAFLLQQQQALPLNTRILLALSHFVIHYWATFPAAVLALMLLIRLWARRHPELWDKAKLNLPLIGRALKKVVLARMAAALALMYGAGIPILEALHTALGTVGNQALRAALQQVEQNVRDGESISAAFRKADLFPPLVVRMVHVGECSGALDAALRNVAYFYSRDAKESIARMQVLLEPLLTVLIGALLGWIMLAVLGPIYDTIATMRT